MLATRHEGVVPPSAPVLVIALEGWIDAGYAAATASGALLEAIPTELLYGFDADELLDHRARRPRMRIEDGVQSGITWPEPSIRIGTDSEGTGVAFLVGPEPDYRWRGFCDEVAGIARQLEVRLVVSLGGFPFAWPHSRPVLLAATASDAALASKVGFLRGAIEAPAGIADVIGARCAEQGIPSVGLWARVPHYVAAMPYPAAAVALLDGLASLAGLSINLTELRENAEAVKTHVDELIAASTDHVEMVESLEEQALAGDDESGGFAGGIPSGDEIASELERYLRGEMQ